MIKISTLKWLLLLEVFLLTGVSQAFAADACWIAATSRNSGGSAVGTPAIFGCAPGQQQDGGLCYNACQPRQGIDFVGVGPLCHQVCPSGWPSPAATDISCPKFAPYFRDAGLVNQTECDKKYQGGCVYDAGLWYQKPFPGYTCAGGMSCTITCPSGYTDQGGFCGKAAGDNRGPAYTRGAGTPMAMTCPASQELDAGLCYNKCADGTKGIGPLCWDNCNRGGLNFQAGALCCTDSGTCTNKITTMVSTMVQALGTIVDAIANEEFKMPDVGAVTAAYNLPMCRDVKQ